MSTSTSDDRLAAVAAVTEELFRAPQYHLGREQKQALLCRATGLLTDWHRARCSAYNNIVEGLPRVCTSTPLEALPFLPVRLFKLLLLQSVPAEEVFKMLRSSGTTSQVPSRIVLDRTTAQAQTRALSAIMTSFLGRERLPMVVCDAKSTISNRASHSARAAGILGMSVFGRDHFYALGEGMELRTKELVEYLAKHDGRRILFFGFTFMVWRHVVQALRHMNVRLSPKSAILVHGGGWKALADSAVAPEAFRAACAEWLGCQAVHDFYGMVEQVGSVYVQCEAGQLHAPNFAEIITRRAEDWQPADVGEEGIIQTISVLPWSYPGHSLLTEDIGVITSRDECGCGRLGTTFAVRGRIAQAELRGCSDTHAEHWAGDRS